MKNGLWDLQLSGDTDPGPSQQPASAIFGFSQYFAFTSRTSGVQILPNRLIRQNI